MATEIPYEFVIDLLYPLPVRTKKMFGVLSVYAGEKIVFALSQQQDDQRDNGIWIATKKKHHQKLKHTFASLRPIQRYSIKSWLLLPEDAEDFEESVFQMVEMIKENSELIGNIPKPKRR